MKDKEKLIKDHHLQKHTSHMMKHAQITSTIYIKHDTFKVLSISQ